MDLAGLSDGPATGSRIGRRSGGARGPAAHTAPRDTANSERLCVGPATAAPAPVPGSGDVDSPAALAATADRRQAEYFLGLLIQRRRLLERRIDEYRKAVAVAEANGDGERAYGVRRMARSEERDRQTLDDMIEKLHRRFPPQAPGNVPPGVQARFAAR